MSNVVIRVENLSKLYRVGQRERYQTLREVLTNAAMASFRRIGSSNTNLKRMQEDDHIWALRDVSFEIRTGEILGIIGRNGAGKSTLLKILSRITKPTRGFAKIRGRVGSLLEVGTGFHPELTGRENIYLNGAVLGMKKAEIDRKFDEIVAFAEVEKFLDTPVKRYSSGMYMRLAFAVAAHLEPEILIVDEVLAVGDLQFQKKCLRKIGNVAQEGRTVLFVSHNMAAISALCSIALVLEQGEVIARGPISRCLAVYGAQVSESCGSRWLRPSSLDAGRITITRVDSLICGKQPHLTLELDIVLESRSKHKSAFLAVDILDSTGTAFMQAVPKLEGFLECTKAEHNVKVTIELPPLIPGQYLTTIWVGSHNTETLDQVREAVKFEIFDSPTPGRSFPHTRDHGYIVPVSTIVY